MRVRMRMRIGTWAVIGRENEHLFLRHMVGFIPRTRFEEESDDVEVES